MKTTVLESVINKVAALQFSSKVTPTQLLFCEISDIFKNISFYRTTLVAAFITRIWRGDN